jgi:predicted adenine nucleotide alpha hydrolase (AANH) superfamily ATPase
MLIFAAAEVAAEERDRVFFSNFPRFVCQSLDKDVTVLSELSKLAKKEKKESYWIQRWEKKSADILEISFLRSIL